MPSAELAPAGTAVPESASPVVNDFSIQVATANGSGSQSANLVLLRSLFQMGIPVSGKNLFPSNIAGLPTWYTIRASKHGFIGRKKEIDFLVAMNPETAQEDVRDLPAGGALVYDEPLHLDETRDDIAFYPVPFDEIVGPVCPNANLRRVWFATSSMTAFWRPCWVSSWRRSTSPCGNSSKPSPRPRR